MSTCLYNVQNTCLSTQCLPGCIRYNCLYSNVYLPIQGTEYLPLNSMSTWLYKVQMCLPQCLPAYTRYRILASQFNVYLPIQGTEYLPLPQCLPEVQNTCLATQCLPGCIRYKCVCLNVYLPLQGTKYLSLSQCLPASAR
jgi:hypothetical protein